MLTISNPFYKNPEANARQLLQQQMLTDANRSAHQAVVELLALRSLLAQGQLCFCIPVGPSYAFGSPPPPQATLLPPPDIQHQQQQPQPAQHHQQTNQTGTVPHSPSSPTTATPHQKETKCHQTETGTDGGVTTETKLSVTLKGQESDKKTSKQDECKFKCDSVELVLDLRSLLPAEVSVTVEEKSIRVEANRVDKDGVRNYWRQYDLPACIVPEAAKCLLTHDGYLHITVPWYRME